MSSTADGGRNPTPLEQRKRPVQSRGKERIRRILEATHRLLKTGGPTALTTPAIAREAEVSVGALYHYFPNKESIVLALYDSKLAEIRALAGEPIVPIDGDWRAGLRRWLVALKQGEVVIDFDLAMNEAFEHFPGLKAVARRHATMQADVVAGQLRALGSTWPDDALFDVAVHAFFVNSSAWLYWSFAGASLPQAVDRLVDCVIALVAPAIEGDDPPPPPYAQRLEATAAT